jgi:hypothetical protein
LGNIGQNHQDLEKNPDTFGADAPGTNRCPDGLAVQELLG